MRAPEDLRCGVRPQQRHDNKHKQQHGVVQGPNPQAPASVEVAKEMLGRPCVEEDASDEKTGKNEKEIHSEPAIIREEREGPRAECVEVVGQDHQNGHTTDAVEFWNFSLHTRCQRPDYAGATLLAVQVSFYLVPQKRSNNNWGEAPRGLAGLIRGASYLHTVKTLQVSVRQQIGQELGLPEQIRMFAKACRELYSILQG